MTGSTIRAFLCAALFLLAGGGSDAGERPRAARGRDRDAWRTRSPARFRPSALCQSTGAKGGRLNLACLGTFDSLNPYNVRAGSTAQGLIGNVFQSLMARSGDEPFTLYGLIASRSKPTLTRSRRLPSRSGRPVLGRNTDHLGRRRLHLRPPQDEGPTAAARRLLAREGRRNPGRLDRGL